MEEKLVKDLENGCTVWGPADAKRIRELQSKHPGWVDVIDDMAELERIEGRKFDGAKQVPYFGAILTDEGKRNIDTLREE